MTDTPEPMADQEKALDDRIMDTLHELFDVIDTLIKNEAVSPKNREENIMPDTTPNNRASTPVNRLIDIAGELLDIYKKMDNAETPGHWQEFTDAEAKLAGAFDEDAISEDAAYAASFDNPDA